MSRLVLVSLIVFFSLLQPATQGVFAAPDQSTTVTLYAHAPPLIDQAKGPILNALPEWGTQRLAPIRQEAVFTLDPSVGSDVSIVGTATMNLWLRADNLLRGFLTLYFTENNADGQSRVIPGAGFTNVPVSLDFRAARPENFALILNFTLARGSTMQLHIKLSSDDTVTGAYVLYDTPATPTQISITVQNPTIANFLFLTGNGEPTRVFEAENDSANATVVTRVNITDSIGLYRLSAADLRATDSSGRVFVSTPDILNSTHRLNEYSAALDTVLSLPAGTYTVTLTIVDRTGKSYVSTDEFFVAVYYYTNIRIIDSSSRPIRDAQLLVSTSLSNYSSYTNKTGWASFRLPSSRVLGPYQLAVSWKNITLLPTWEFRVDNGTVLSIVFPAFDLSLGVKLLWFDLPGTQVSLISDSKTVLLNFTNSSGRVLFPQIPPGRYLVDIRYFGVDFRTEVNVDQQTSKTIQVPIPYQDQLPYAALVIVAVIVGSVVLRRRRVYESPFEYFNVLAKGGLPNSLTTTIVGSSGSGKTVLMESLAHETLKSGRGCILVTNVELPSTTRTTMKNLGIETSEYESQGKMVFIDCYSALSGTPSKEKRTLGSITDLTSLGILITASIEEIRGVTDVYFDSLTVLFATLKPDYILSFLQSVGAKVKSYNGRLCATIGTSLDKETLTGVEEISDCVIETQVVETRSGQRRRLRIKKLRGHPYVDTWTKFTISGEKGISFLTNKPFDSKWAGKKD